MNKRVYKVLNERYKEILRSGAFPKVAFSEWQGGQSYSMFEYTLNWTRFATVVHNQLLVIDPNGIFTKKYNKALLEQIEEITSGVTVEDIDAQGENRLKSKWMD